ncbi:MAG: hypothetical protein K2K82_04095, partial [Muribaculaceae bacterium]|nr:hypothetical protein [Muribaculaceae bacterium]
MSETSTEHPVNDSGRINSLMLRFLRWRQHHIKEKNFVLILALIVGIICGFAALTLKWLIHFISIILTGHLISVGG